MQKSKVKNLKPVFKKLSAGALVLAAFEHAHAQYTPPPPPAPFQGFINEFFRAKDPYMNQWDIGGNTRFRYENRQGYGIPGITGSVDFRDHGTKVNNDYYLTRTRLHVGYTDKWWSAFVEGQSSTANNDARYAYADAPAVPGTVKRKGNGPEADLIDVHQGYVTLGNQKEFPLTAKVGRQELSYGEERLIGAFNWNNIGRSFDAAKVRWQNEWFGADFFSGRPVVPQDGQFDVANTYDFLSGMYATSMKVPKNILDVYFLARNTTRQANSAEPSPQFPQPTARDIYTVGGRVKSKPGELAGWDYSVEGAYQFGDFAPTTTAARLKQNAFMFVVQGGYTFTNLWSTPRLGLEYDYGSGDNNPNDGTHGTFENLFPTNHKFYGSMDLVSLQNIQDAGINLTCKPTSRMSCALMGNALWLANTDDYFYTVSGTPRTTGGYGVNPNYNSFLGTELTAVTGYAVTRFAQVEAGYAHFFVGKYVEQSLAGVGGATDANFFYVQTSINF